MITELSESYLDVGDAVGRHSDVVAQLVEELRRNPQGGAAELKLIGPERDERKESFFLYFLSSLRLNRYVRSCTIETKRLWTGL